MKNSPTRPVLGKRGHYDYLLCGYNMAIFDKVVQILKDEKKDKTLDVGAGQGVLTKKLKEAGFTMFACDLEPRYFTPKDIPIKKADLRKKLPYPSSTFQNIVCTEVFEHLENPWHACQELSRLLKTGGILVITLPNFSNLISRFVFLIRGNFRQFDEWYWKNWGHVNPITFTQIKIITEKAGFEIVEITTQEKVHNLSTLIIRLLQKKFSLIYHFFRLHYFGHDRLDTSHSFLETDTLLYGENLIIKLKKVKTSDKTIYY